MDEATGQGSQAVENAGRDERTEEELRRDIAATREELGETVAALAEKSDVKAQARQRAEHIKQTALGKKDELLGKKDELLGKKDELVGKAKATSPESAGAGAQRVATTVQQNPLALYIGGALLVGFFLGRRGRGG